MGVALVAAPGGGCFTTDARPPFFYGAGQRVRASRYRRALRALERGDSVAAAAHIRAALWQRVSHLASEANVRLTPRLPFDSAVRRLLRTGAIDGSTAQRLVDAHDTTARALRCEAASLAELRAAMEATRR